MPLVIAQPSANLAQRSPACQCESEARTQVHSVGLGLHRRHIPSEAQAPRELVQRLFSNGLLLGSDGVQGTTCRPLLHVPALQGDV